MGFAPHRSVKWLLAVLYVVAQTPAASGQTALDASFGAAGVATFDFGGAYDDVQAISVASDGKVWAVGTGGASNRFAVARLTPKGQPDDTFSGDGKLIIGASAGASAVHALSGGQVLLGVPRLIPEPRGFQAVRLTNSGAFDGTFGVGGAGFIETSSQVYIEGLVRQADEKILIGGYDFFGGDWNFVVTRFNPDGSPDNGFGTGGRVITNFNRTGMPTPQDNLEALAVLSDGRIIAGGHSEYDFALACYLPDGKPDPDFGTDGKRVFTIGAAADLDSVTDIYPLPQGKFLATMGLRNDTALARFNADGTLDGTFGTGGRIIAPTNAPWRDPSALALDAQGRMLLGGGSSISVTRLLANGALDTTFGTGGTFDINVGATFRKQVSDLEWAPNGDLIIGAYSIVTANVDSNWHVARLALGTPSPTQTVTLAPTFDVKASVWGATRSITDGETGLVIGLGFDAGNPEERPIFEFPLSGVPLGATLTAATLKLDPYVSSGSPRVEVQSFSGDGLASLSDIDSPGTVVATTSALSASLPSIEINLSLPAIQALLDSGTPVGLRLRSLDVPLYVGFGSSEAAFGSPPRLDLTYMLPKIAGDFTGDGLVDGNDLTSWRNAFLSGGGDADDDGDTDGADFLAWQRSLGPSSAIHAAAAMPEPCALSLLFAGLLVARRKRRSANGLRGLWPPAASRRLLP
jgi:uncharacterized delta-60 repeat protein